MPLLIPRQIPTLAAVIPVLLTIVGGVWGVAEAWDHNGARVTALETRAQQQDQALKDAEAAQDKYRSQVQMALVDQKKTLSDHGVALAVVANDITNIKEIVSRIDKKLDRR